jgi:hypothetical protein
MSSKAEINRNNAQHSTGPKTEAGKQRSSRNALSHGLTAKTVVMPTEDLAAYQSHLKSFDDEYKPQGGTEVQLVQQLADTSWRLNRVASLEAKLLAADAPIETQAKALANLSLHSQRLSRQFKETVAQLRDLQKIRMERETQEMAEFMDIYKLHQGTGEPYEPSDYGFVFSTGQMNQAICLRSRERALQQAGLGTYL